MALDIITMAERLLFLEESDFRVSTGLLVEYKGDLVFVVHNPDRWVVEGNTKKAGVVGVGGKLERGETVVECVKRECREEICTDVSILDSQVTYVVTGKYAKKLTLEGAEKPRPYYIILLEAEKSDRSSRIVVFTYKGEIYEEPKPGDVSALLLVKEATLRHMGPAPVTVKTMREYAAQFVERIRLPDDLYLTPCGTLLTYLRLECWQSIDD